MGFSTHLVLLPLEQARPSERRGRLWDAVYPQIRHTARQRLRLRVQIARGQLQVVLPLGGLLGGGVWAWAGIPGEARQGLWVGSGWADPGANARQAPSGRQV